MIRLLVILALVACERSSSTPTPAPPHPEPPRPACAPVADRELRLAALDRLRHRVTATQRSRSPVEAPLELTGAYVDFEFAYGYARLGRPELARELVAAARAVLAPIHDPVHDYLAAAYATRVDEAIVCGPRHPERSLVGFERTMVYKIDRLREVSRVLTTSHVDAIGRFARRELPSDEAPAAILDGLPALRDGDRVWALQRALDDLDAMSPDAARPLLARVVAQIPQTQLGELLYGSAIAVASRVDRAVLPSLIEEAVKHLDGGTIASASDALRALRDDPVSLRALWGRLPEPGDCCTAIYAAGLVRLGDLARARPFLESAHTVLETQPTFSAKGRPLLQGLALAYSLAPAKDGLAGIDKLAALYPKVTDSFGTNSHYAQSVVAFVSELVGGIVGYSPTST